MNDQLALFDVGKTTRPAKMGKNSPSANVTTELASLSKRLEHLEALAQQIHELVSQPQIEKEAYTTADGELPHIEGGVRTPHEHGLAKGGRWHSTNYRKGARAVRANKRAEAGC